MMITSPTHTETLGILKDDLSGEKKLGYQVQISSERWEQGSIIVE